VTTIAEHLITTVAKKTTCGTCGAPILDAHDEGSRVRVDATQLRDRQAEINALLDGRRTYKRTLYGQLHYRDETQLRKPHDPEMRIHAEHKCTRNEQLALEIGAS
jgi:hypothetical protein